MSKKIDDDIPLLDFECNDNPANSGSPSHNLLYPRLHRGKLDPHPPEWDVRIVLVGKTGAGKSATGNTILRQRSFQEGVSPSAITKECSSGVACVGGRTVRVIDSPGIFGSLDHNINVEEQIKDCVRMSLPGPHAFLLVIKVGRFTEEEKNAVEWICENFGEDASLYTLILFTHTDQLKGKALQEYIGESRHLLRFIDRYGGRYLGFNNVEPDNDQVRKLLEKIDEMVERNGKTYYTNEMFQKAQQEMLQRVEEEKKRKKKEKIKETVLGAATAVGVGGVVAGGVVLGVTGAVVLPAAGVVAGGAVAVGAGAKMVYDKVKNKKDGQQEAMQPTQK